MGTLPDVSRFPEGIKLPGGAITTTKTMTLAESGGVFTVDQGSAYTITLPTVAVAGVGIKYTFFVIAVAANTVGITSGAAVNEGCIVLDASVVVATGENINFVSGALIGDCIEVQSNGISWLVRAVSSAAAGITAT